jgi:hypothetical protein
MNFILPVKDTNKAPLVAPGRTKPDFYAGPVMDTNFYSIYQDTVWNRLWKLDRADIEYHKIHYADPGYVPVEAILTWPGNGDVSMGQAEKLAPFVDLNGDGIYEPMQGDYPEVRGDQSLFFIFNDIRGNHLESFGSKLGIEIHGMAYAFDIPSDSAIKNTVFLYYKIFNRSLTTYDSTLIGIFADIDLGWPIDDLVGCDVERNTYFSYNGDTIDGSGQSYAYGAHPPAQGVTLLAGPFMDPDGKDDPRFDAYGNRLCDVSVNGFHFGDSIIDNERLGMQRFLMFNNSLSGFPDYMSDPDYAPEYYAMLNGIWKDGSHMIYGGNGNASTGGYGPECRFMFPGESDTLNWGTGCIPPYGPKNWTEETAGNNPGDRRGIIGTGPFTFGPGDVQELDIAFVWARDYDGTFPYCSVDKLRSMVDIVNEAFLTNKLSNGEIIYGMEEDPMTQEMPVNIYPNPTSQSVTIDLLTNDIKEPVSVFILNNQGICVAKTEIPNGAGSETISLSSIPSGFYFVRIVSGKQQTTKKLLVLH